METKIYRCSTIIAIFLHKKWFYKRENNTKMPTNSTWYFIRKNYGFHLENMVISKKSYHLRVWRNIMLFTMFKTCCESHKIKIQKNNTCQNYHNHLSNVSLKMQLFITNSLFMHKKICKSEEISTSWILVINYGQFCLTCPTLCLCIILYNIYDEGWL